MLSGVKFIPREELLEDEEDNSSADKQKKMNRKQEKHRRRDRSDESSERDERRTRKCSKKMRSGSWSCSDADSDSSERVTSSHSDKGDRKSKSRDKSSRHERDGRKKRDRVGKKKGDQSGAVDEKKSLDGDTDYMIDQNIGISRKEMGLEWMLQAGNSLHGNPASTEIKQEEHQVEEGKRVNPKELNPYLQDDGSGYPNDALNSAGGSSQLLSSSLVGDGGASWRLKALKRAKEQAAREGLTLQEVVGERWGSLQELATSVAVHRSAPAHAHLHAIKERKKGQSNIEEAQDKHHLSSGKLDMKKPKQDNLQWRSKHFKKISLEDSSLASEAISCINKFSNDGSFMNSIINQQNEDSYVHDHSFTETKEAKSINEEDLASESRDFGELLSTKMQAVSSNQLAAKVLQLRMKGKHEEADNLSKHMDLLVENSNARSKAIRQEAGGKSSRFIEKHLSGERKKHENDGDKHLAQKIVQNRRYSMSGNADDEYDFYEGAPSRKHSKKKDDAHEDKNILPKQMLTQKERCQFCFENQSRPKHLVVSIGNFTYLMLPHWEPVLQGHCCILPLQHESATRTIDKNVWEEIRNFKKCLLKMFSKQDKDVIFLETVIGLSRQRRHCLIECIPIPSHIAKQAPLYFKKAIDEAEDEWGQHDMKKVIPTNGNLRSVIPENFSYFHVEFGLDRGFVHVIDDDSNFPSSFGLNVVRGMLRLPVETMHHHQRREPAEKQKQAVATFVQEWEPFDWTREID
ncbi:CWF19-like protein 2 [Dendrobium catenatum]|uniref:Zinc finger CCCH domain-containing protein 59 n=1 Tax=Dendrobium catenatum TaxID=906689 RepID=A0A2I0VPV2_9ASPA|nr:CWF19-like protein 2 [Dendrobium catenatum]PKU65430.1 Zinc finger CCCH domain-containing protein 59 [Dendrobium catenatum]